MNAPTIHTREPHHYPRQGTWTYLVVEVLDDLLEDGRGNLGELDLPLARLGEVACVCLWVCVVYAGVGLG